MRAHRSVVSLFSACLLSSAVIAQQDSTDKLPLDLFLGMVDAQGKQQCEQDRVKANAASGEREKLKAGLAVKLQCECLPAQLATLTGNPDLPKEVTQEEAMALITPLLERCAGLGMREFLVSSCPIVEMPDHGIKDQKAYCACFARHLEKLSDAEFTVEAVAAHTDSEARVEARKDGKPKPPKRAGPLQQFDDMCRAEQGASPD
jgi:hypothetical protein